jgi:biotin synthase-related radical SAM superfamily protein
MRAGVLQASDFDFQEGGEKTEKIKADDLVAHRDPFGTQRCMRASPRPFEPILEGPAWNQCVVLARYTVVPVNVSI